MPSTDARVHQAIGDHHVLLASTASKTPHWLHAARNRIVSSCRETGQLLFERAVDVLRAADERTLDMP